MDIYSQRVLCLRCGMEAYGTKDSAEKRMEMEFSGKKKIVAVDDSGIILKMLIKVLGDAYDLHAFSSGKRALQFLKDKTPDLIILDIDMPEINGYEMLKLIREREQLKDIPIIFLTSNNDKSYVVKAVAVGADDYVIKPIDEELLRGKVRALLDAAGNNAISWDDI